MKLSEFRRKCLSVRYDPFLGFWNCNLHLIVHQSAFDHFWINMDDIKIAKCSKFRKEHLHLIVHTTKKIKDCWNIRGEKILNDKHLEFILLHYFSRKPQRHNFICQIKFDNFTLFTLSLKKILNRLHDVYSLTELGLSKNILMILFEHCETLIKIPTNKDKLIFSPIIRYYFKEIDICFERNIVSTLQNQSRLYFHGAFIVSNEYVSEKGQCFQRCKKCIQLHGLFSRRFVYRRMPVKPYIQNPQNWCHVCKKVPLFQIYTFEEFVNLYGCPSKHIHTLKIVFENY